MLDYLLSSWDKTSESYELRLSTLEHLHQLKAETNKVYSLLQEITT